MSDELSADGAPRPRVYEVTCPNCGELPGLNPVGLTGEAGVRRGVCGSCKAVLIRDSADAPFREMTRAEISRLNPTQQRVIRAVQRGDMAEFERLTREQRRQVADELRRRGGRKWWTG